jgi:hypothetical protein
MQRVRALFLLVAAVVCLVVVSLYIYALSLTRRAEALIQATYDLSTYRGSALPLKTLQDRFGGRLQSMEGCNTSECSYKVSLSNEVLASLRVVPYTELVSTFWVRDGVVDRNMLDFTTRVHDRHSIVLHVQTDFSDSDEFDLHPWMDSSPTDTNGLVGITSGVPLENKKLALALNLHCLTKPGGCSNVAEMLPTLWQATANGKINCRISNHEGFIDAPPSLMR